MPPQMVLVVKNPPARAGDTRDLGMIPGSGRFPGGGNGNPLLYPCLKNPMDRGDLRATVHGVSKSQTGLTTHICMHFIKGTLEERERMVRINRCGETEEW